jgi:membrane protease YdiL (CAAX protease family)
MNGIKKKKLKNGWYQRVLLKIILNVWTILTMVLFTVDFMSGNYYDTSVTAIGIIYIAILGIYVSEKEYTRWKNHFISEFIGESFVVIWTVIMVVFIVAAPLSNGQFKIPEGFAVVYTSVVAAFALTQHSKALKTKK